MRRRNRDSSIGRTAAKSDVFLCYSEKEDRLNYIRLEELLTGAYFTTYDGAWQHGGRWEKHRQVQRAIEQSHVCVIFIGPDSAPCWNHARLWKAIEKQERDRSHRVILVSFIPYRGQELYKQSLETKRKSPWQDHEQKSKQGKERVYKLGDLQESQLRHKQESQQKCKQNHEERPSKLEHPDMTNARLYFFWREYICEHLPVLVADVPWIQFPFSKSDAAFQVLVRIALDTLGLFGKGKRLLRNKRNRRLAIGFTVLGAIAIGVAVRLMPSGLVATGTVGQGDSEAPRMTACVAYESLCSAPEKLEFSSGEGVCVAWTKTSRNQSSESKGDENLPQSFAFYIYNDRDERVFAYEEFESKSSQQDRDCRIVTARFSPKVGDYRTEFWIGGQATQPTVAQWSVEGTPEASEYPWEQQTPIILKGDKGGRVEALAFSPDGRWLANGAESGVVQIWDVANLEAKPAVQLEHENSVVGVAFSPDGRWLATKSSDGIIRLWETTYPVTDPIILHGCESEVGTIAFSLDGRWLTVMGENGTIQLWDIIEPTSSPLELKDDQGSNLAASFTPDGDWLSVVGTDGTIWAWDMTDPVDQNILRVGRIDSVQAAAFSIDRYWMLTGNKDGAIWLWQMDDPGAASRTLYGYHSDQVETVAVSPDGHWLATVSEGVINLWDATNAGSDPIDLSGYGGPMSTMAFSPGSRWLAVGSTDGIVGLWRLRPD